MEFLAENCPDEVLILIIVPISKALRYALRMSQITDREAMPLLKEIYSDIASLIEL